MLDQHGQLPAVMLLAALSAFVQQHEHGGELDSSLDGDYVGCVVPVAGIFGGTRLPAWLVLGSLIWSLELGALFSPEGGVPPAFLSIACSLCAYVIGVMRGLARSPHGA